MADVNIKIIGKNEASTAIRQVKTDLGGLDSAARTVSGGMSSLLGVVGVAGLATLAVGIVRTGAALGDLGERVVRSEKYFTAFSGSTQKASANLEAMRRATDGAVSTQEAMNAAASIMGMGLASTADELEKFARMAVLLGGNTRTATDAINEFQLLIANQSILRLDTFGISGARVRARIEELMAATQGLTREQAFLNAVMEEGSKKVEQLEAAGVTAGTSQDRLAAATKDLKAELSKLVEKPYTITVEFLVKEVRDVVAAASPEGQKERDYTQAFAVYQKAAQGRIYLEEQLAQAQERGDARSAYYVQTNLTAARAHEAVALAAYKAGQGLQDYTLNGENVITVSDAMSRAMLGTAAAAEKLAGTTTGTFTEPSKTRWSLYADMAKHFEEEGSLTATQYFDRRKADNARLATDAATKWQTAMNEAGAQWLSKMQEGMNFSIGLNDQRPGGANGPNAPGANGAYEDIYRLQAFIADGSWASTANAQGVNTAAQAQAIVTKFQTGAWDKSVMDFVDEDKLKAQIAQANIGKAMMDAVVADLAKGTGSDPNAIRAQLGLGGATSTVTPPTAAAASRQFTVNVQQGAIVVYSDDPQVTANAIVGLVFKEFAAAESRVGAPPPALAPGAQ